MRRESSKAKLRVGKRKVKPKFRRRRSVRVCKDESRINGLPDDLLVKILSFLPTKIAVSTSILSKQWQFLRMWLPKLDFKSRYHSEPAIKEFIDKNLPSHRAPVIESLRFKLRGKQTKPEDIKRWIEIAVSRRVRELEISYESPKENIFPSSLYICESLVILKLEYMILMDVPSMACLPCLKTLELESVQYESEESLQRLLSICPVLEELSVLFCNEALFGEFSIIVPSLQRLSLIIDDDFWRLGRYVIDTPCLKYFKLEDWNGTYCEIKNMPNLREAYVEGVSCNLKSVVGSITSVKRLTICSEDDDYGDGFVFNELEHLKICLCEKDSSNLLAQLLKDSPNLRVLEISHMEDHGDDERNLKVRWNQPSHVPECLLSSLQTFKWSRYFGRRQDLEIAVYMLKNASRLKKATIVADTEEHCVPNLRMVKELTLSTRASSTCELVFVEGHHVVSRHK